MNICFGKYPIPDDDGVLQELHLHHPVHLTPDEDGHLPPSAFVPFCSYQGDASLLGEKIPELDNITMCNKFKSTIIDGQICYSLDIAKQMEKKRTGPGKENGLFLLMDSNPYALNSSNQQSFKVFIHTLAQYIAIGPGSYAMGTLKSMTGTEDFVQLPVNQKKCLVHNREECQTDKFLDQTKSNCGCVPWPLRTDGSQEKVTQTFEIDSPQQAYDYCGLEKETCVASQTLRDDSCLVPCVGLSADISDDSFQQAVVEGDV